MSWYRWDHRDKPIIVTAKETKVQIETNLNRIRTAAKFISHDVYCVLDDPCTFIIEHSIQCDRETESELAKKQRQKRHQEREALRKEAWATKHGMQR